MSDHPPTPEAATAAALHDGEALFTLLDRWVARGWLRALDRAFAAFLAREVPDAPAPLLLAAALIFLPLRKLKPLRDRCALTFASIFAARPRCSSRLGTGKLSIDRGSEPRYWDQLV